MTLQAEPINAQARQRKPWNFDVLLAADWRELRATRLRALRESPHAFVATYAEEVALGEKHWRSRLWWTTWMVARLGDETIGLARLRTPDDEPSDVRYIESVWVHPDHRCQGVVRSMMEELELHAMRAGVTRLRLWVLDTNQSAADVYIKLGYHPEPGRVQESPKASLDSMPVYERRMVKDVLAPPSGHSSRGVTAEGAPLAESKELLERSRCAGDAPDALRGPLPLNEIPLPRVEVVDAEFRAQGGELIPSGLY